MEGYQRNRNCPCVDTLVALTQAESVKEKANANSFAVCKSCCTTAIQNIIHGDVVTEYSTVQLMQLAAYPTLYLCSISLGCNLPQ
jgi:hypothetical protein